jgi:hypothetical protein
VLTCQQPTNVDDGKNLQAELRKSRQSWFVATGKKFIVDVTVVLHPEAMSNSNSYTQTKLDVFGFILDFWGLSC